MSEVVIIAVKAESCGYKYDYRKDGEGSRACAQVAPQFDHNVMIEFVTHCCFIVPLGLIWMLPDSTQSTCVWVDWSGT
jgi:hypothetical protein